MIRIFRNSRCRFGGRGIGSQMALSGSEPEAPDWTDQQNCHDPLFERLCLNVLEFQTIVVLNRPR